jgi:hypothetical protein
MANGAHIIGKQILDVRIQPHIDGFAIQREINRILQGPLSEAVEELFSRHVDEDLFIRLDRVDIDLGCLDHTRLEDEVIEKVVENLERFLRIRLESVPPSNDESSAVCLSRQAHIVELWCYFLEYGHFPWWAKPQNHEAFEHDVLRVLAETDSIKRVRSTLARSSVARSRLSLQFGDAFLGSFVDICASGFGSQVARFIAALPRETVRRYLERSRSLGICEMVWQETLEAVFGRPSAEGVPDLRAVLEAVLRRAIDRPVSLQIQGRGGQEIALLADRVREALEEHMRASEERGETARDRETRQYERDEGEGPDERKDYPPESSAESIDSEVEQSTSRKARDVSSETRADSEHGSEAQESARKSTEDGRRERTETEPSSDGLEDSSDLGAADSSRGNVRRGLGARGDGFRQEPDIFPDDDRRPGGRWNERNSGNRTTDEEDVLYVSHAGVVLLHPFLSMHFEHLTFVQDGVFVTERAREQAVHQLYYLATGELQAPEYGMTLHKVLCGLRPEDLVARRIEVWEEAQAEGERLLEDVIGHWQALKNTSADGLREGFLQREGKLTRTIDGWKLQVEQKSFDVLLSRVPWSRSLVRLPWMSELLHVEWG